MVTVTLPQFDGCSRASPDFSPDPYCDGATTCAYFVGLGRPASTGSPTCLRGPRSPSSYPQALAQSTDETGEKRGLASNGRNQLTYGHELCDGRTRSLSSVRGEVDTVFDEVRGGKDGVQVQERSPDLAANRP